MGGGPTWDPHDGDSAELIGATLDSKRATHDVELLKVRDGIHPVFDQRPPRDAHQVCARIAGIAVHVEQPRVGHVEPVDPLFDEPAPMRLGRS